MLDKNYRNEDERYMVEDILAKMKETPSKYEIGDPIRLYADGELSIIVAKRFDVWDKIWSYWLFDIPEHMLWIKESDL